VTLMSLDETVDEVEVARRRQESEIADKVVAIYPTSTCNRGQGVVNHTVDQFDEESFFHKLYVTKVI
jgi:hypothetical protein